MMTLVTMTDIRRKMRMNIKFKALAVALAAVTALSCASVTAFADKLKTVDGVTYRYSDNGEAKGKYTGWAKTSKGRYCYKDGVKLKNKWIKDSKGRYRYLDKYGRMVTGWYEISRGGGKYSWFDENGYWDGNSYCSKYSDAVRFGTYVRIKVSRNDIISEPLSGNYSADSLVSKKKAASYINNTEYELEVPLAVAEQLITGDKLVFKAGVSRGEKVNGAYTYKLTIPHTSALTASKIDSSAPYEQKVKLAALNRFDLFNSLLVLRNGRLKLDMMYDAYRLDTKVLLDEEDYGYFLDDDAKMYVINREEKEITYGLFGGYNKLNEKKGKYAFRNGITEKALLALMKEKITSHREARYEDEHPKDSVYSDTDWLEWVGNMLYCWLDVTVVGIDWLPEAAAPTEDMYEEYQTDVLVADDEEETWSSADSVKTIPELYNDYIVLSGMYYVNIENEPSWQSTKFEKSINSPGKITANTDSRVVSEIPTWQSAASVLPVGTQLWWAKGRNDIVLAELDGRLIPYVKMVEG